MTILFRTLSGMSYLRALSGGRSKTLWARYKSVGKEGSVKQDVASGNKQCEHCQAIPYQGHCVVEAWIGRLAILSVLALLWWAKDFSYVHVAPVNRDYNNLGENQYVCLDCEKVDQAPGNVPDICRK